jgi:hypothetical protein
MGVFSGRPLLEMLGMIQISPALSGWSPTRCYQYFVWQCGFQYKAFTNIHGKLPSWSSLSADLTMPQIGFLPWHLQFWCEPFGSHRGPRMTRIWSGYSWESFHRNTRFGIWFFLLNPASVWFPCEVYKIHKSFFMALNWNLGTYGLYMK